MSTVYEQLPEHIRAELEASMRGEGLIKASVQPAAEEEDWLSGPACQLDADGNIDPECSACQ